MQLGNMRQVPGYEVSITTGGAVDHFRGPLSSSKGGGWVGLSWFDGVSDELFTVTCSTFGLTFRVAASNLTVAPHM